MKKILLIILLACATTSFSQISEMVLPSGDTVYVMSRNTRDIIFENLRELKQRREDTASYIREISIANERIGILRDSIVKLLMPKKDSLFTSIIEKEKKADLVKIDGLFTEAEIGYLSRNSEMFISLGAMLNVKLWNFTLAPGFKIFNYQQKYEIGPFLRAGLKIY